MKEARFDDLERLFSKHLSDQKMSEAFPGLLPDDVWSKIETQIQRESVLRLPSLFGWVMITILMLLLFAWSASGYKTGSSDLNSLPLPGHAKMDFTLLSLDPLPEVVRLTPESDHPVIKGNPGTHNEMSGQEAEGQEGPAKTPTPDMPVISMVQGSSVSAGEGNSVPPVYEKLKPVDSRVFLLTNRKVPVFSTKSTPLVRSDADQDWSVQFSAGGLIGDYFSRGQSFLDGNSLKSIERQWSPALGLSIRRVIKDNLSVQAGVRYVSYRTLANYEFRVSQAQNLESPTPDGYERVINHNIPTVGGEFAATTLIGRDFQSNIADDEIIPLQAGLQQSVHLLAFPVSIETRVLSSSRFEAGIRIGLELNVPLRPLEIRQKELRSLHEMISFESISLAPLQRNIQKDIYGSYLFGTYFHYSIGESGYSVLADLIYSNSVSPAFQLDTEKIFPRNAGIMIGLTKNI